MNHHQSWQRLVAAARGAGDERDVSAPYGFATRVASRAMKQPAFSPWAVFERFAVRGLIAACACSVAAVAFSYTSWAGEEDGPAADAVSEVLDLS